MKTYVFDIDGTICTNTYGEYENAEPYLEKIKKINSLYSRGNYIKYFTARGSGTGIDRLVSIYTKTTRFLGS